MKTTQAVKRCQERHWDQDALVVTRSQLCSVGGARSVTSRSFSSRSRCVSLAACRAWLTRACPAAVEVIEARLIEARSASCQSHATSLPKPLDFLGLRRSQSCLPSVPRSSAIDSSTLRFLRKVVCGLCRSRSFESAVFSNSLLQTRSENAGRARTAACGHARRATSSISLRVL